MVKLSPSKTVVGRPLSAKVAYFSSRGPNFDEPAILKVYDTLFSYEFGLNFLGASVINYKAKEITP